MIYFIRDADAVKIGYAIDPKSRLRTLRTGNSRLIFILGIMDGSQEKEHHLHGIFKDDHIQGEWFKLTPRIIQFIEENCRPIIETRRSEIVPGKNRALIRGNISPKPKPDSINQIGRWRHECIISGDGETAYDLEKCYQNWSYNCGIFPIGWTMVSRILTDFGHEKVTIPKNGTIYNNIKILDQYPGCKNNRNERLYHDTFNAFISAASRPIR